jgi:hypothetical protein
MWVSNVVFPAPRNPLNNVTGNLVGGNLVVADMSAFLFLFKQ